MHGPEVNAWWCALGALVVALAIQVGTNYANDYSDGIRGTDDARVGPVRLTATGLASPGAVKRAAFLAFGVAGVVGLGLAWATSWWVLLVGAACLLAGWFYTGGPRPYGYAGLGEVFVFVFFGLVATVGTYYVQTLRLDVWQVWVAGGDGRPAGDRAAPGQQPPRHRHRPRSRASAPWPCASGGAPGDGATRPASACRSSPWRCGVSWPSPVRSTARGRRHCSCRWPHFRWRCRRPGLALGDAEGRALLPVLAATGRLQLAFGALLAVALWSTLAVVAGSV